MKVKGNLDVAGVLTEQGQPVGGEVTFTDGTNSHTSDELNFNGNDFYLSTDLSGSPVVNLAKSGVLSALISDNSGSAQTIDSDPGVQKTYDTIVIDDGGWADLDNNQFVVPSGRGISAVRCLINATFSSTGNASRRRVFVQVDQLDGNGFQDPPGAVPNESKVANTSDVTQMQLITQIISVSDGYKFRAMYAEGDTGSVDLPANGSNWFQIEEVAVGGSAGEASGNITVTDGVNSHISNVLNFNDNDFYVSTNLSGTPVVNAIDNSNINFSDGVNSHASSALNFNGDNFYLSTNLSGDPVVNIIELTSFPKGYIDGFFHALDSDADHDVNVSSGGVCRDKDDSVNIITTTDITKQIDATWAEGDDAGGMNDSEHPVSTDTWYRFFVISKPDGTCDYGWDTDADAINLLSDSAVVAAGYNKARQIAWHLTDGSSNIISYIQNSEVLNRITWDVPQIDESGTTPSASRVAKTLSAPPGSTADMTLAWGISGGSTLQIFALVLPTGSTDSAPTGPLSNFSSMRVPTNISQANANIKIQVDSSSQMQLRWSSASGTYSISTHNYIYNREKL